MELREVGGFELREDGGKALREQESVSPPVIDPKYLIFAPRRVRTIIGQANG